MRTAAGINGEVYMAIELKEINGKELLTVLCES